MKPSLRKLLTVGALALPLPQAFAQTTVTAGSLGIVRGPADLDLTGEMVYAVNFSPNDPPIIISGVTFTPDYLPPEGASFNGPNNVAPWQTRPEFGDTRDADNLERVYEDIRYALPAAGQQLEAHLPVTPGQTYKVQVLFYGNRAGDNRYWDIGVEGVMSVDQVSSLGESPDGSEPAYDIAAGIVFTQQITAADDTLDIVFGQLGGNGDGTDLNPIWQGLTVERIVPDTDNDGLPDAWETATFGNLAQTATGDGDSDGVPNYVELNLGTNGNNPDTDGDGLNDGMEYDTLGTNPRVTDTDGDGLSDGAEVNTHHTSPLAKDTDLDGLEDGAEINTHGTDPNDTDSDNDDYPDGNELANGADPKNAANFPLLSSFARAITGADAGDGLDLTGTFKYAFNVGTNGAPGLIRGVDFTDETNNGNGGITISPGAEIPAWEAVPEVGDSPDDLNLQLLLHSIRHAGPNPGRMTVKMDGLTPGKPYKIQLLFMERCCQRAFDVFIDGQQKLDDFAPIAYQDGFAAPIQAAAVVIGFLATGTSVEVALDGNGVTNPAYNDHNPILSGVTLEELTGADADGDGLDDLWEINYFSNLAQGAAGDPDGDGLTNAVELVQGTNPTLPDSDGDGLTDGAEVNTHHTDPRKADSDSDGLTDGYEILTSHTLPTSSDSDADGYGDAAEVAAGTNPSSAAVYPLFRPAVGFFTGGDPGEGLDMTGTFLYAFNAGSPGAAPGPVQDVNFSADTDAGIVVTAVNEIPNWHAPAYGDTENDNNLEFVMQSIRWSAAPDVPTVELTGLTPGAAYKLQLLFAEQSSIGRGFDIELEGTGRVHEFVTSIPQGGVGNAARGSVVTLGFIAPDDTMNLALNGDHAISAEISDRNPILSALTLEALTLPDTDGDGLADVWEMQFFGDLTKAAAADTDGDGIPNSVEYTAGTNPNSDDTDGDGVKDGTEKTLGTNPFYPDSDGDGVSDGQEVSVLHTDPLTADSDADTFTDGVEVLCGSNPADGASLPALTVAPFTGGDPDEGLDLEGVFPYAVNLGTNAVFGDGHAGDAVFTADSAPGVTLGTTNEIGNWATTELGDSQADNVLETVLNSIRWSPNPNTPKVSLAGLTPGQRYKAQLIFSEPGANRGFDVNVEGVTIVEDFSPGTIQGNTNTQGSVIAFEFIAPDNTLNVILNGSMFTGAVDKNPTISGITLEALGAPPASDLPTVAGVTTGPGGVAFTIQGTAGKVYALDYSPSLAAGTWVEVNDNVVIGAGGSATVTDSVPAHNTPGRGFWRFRDAAARPNP